MSNWIGRLLDRIPLASDYRAHLQLAADIAPQKHAQLLKMSFERLIYGLTVMPLIAFFAVLFYGSQREMLPMSLWALGYGAAFFYRKRLSRQFNDDMVLLDGASMMARWVPKLKLIVTVHGLALCTPFVLTAFDPLFEFTTLWYLVIAAIVASNAAHQTPVLSIFARFFNCSWNIASVLSVIVYPDHWYYITPMILMFTGANYRHAIMAHKFFLQQVRLEESSSQLATQFKLAKEAAEDALQAKNRFLATASHDLRQPVHAMGMLIEAISHRNRDAALEPPLIDLRSNLRAMNLMFNSLLDLSKLEAGVIPVERKPIHLQSLIREIATLFDHEARDRQLQLRLHLPQRSAMALADPNLMRQIMLNLTQNALRYTSAGGVLLAVRRRGANWQIEVCDSGIGVAEDMQSEIYLPYFRNSQAWHAGSEGHGLGLSVVARCALLLKTNVEMKSRLGRGSRFWLQIPALTAEAAASVGQALETQQPVSHELALLPIGRGRCLIVEDDPQVSRAWQVLMESWAVETRIASYSAEALTFLDEGFVPQVILCDERLRAGESGFELLKALLARVPQAHGAMVSGEFNAPALKQAEEEGYLVFRKPVEVELMHNVLSRWLH
jgi:signal transduction histidine kinase